MATAAEIYIGLNGPGKRQLRQIKFEEKNYGNELVKHIVCLHFNITYKQIESASREKEIVYPRQIAMYLLRQLTNLTLKQIGKMFGNRHHATVISSTEHIQDLIDTEVKTRELILHFKQELKLLKENENTATISN